MRNARFFLCLLACVRTEFAQNPAEITLHDEPTTFSSKVNLVIVPVVVRDRTDKAVAGLKQEDFQLFDKGKPQTITKFSVEQTGGAAPGSGLMAKDVLGKPTSDQSPSVLPGHYLLYLFDDVHLEFGDLVQVRTAALKYVSSSLTPTDRAAIFTTSGQGMQDFTDDKEKLREALLRLQPRPIARSSFQDCP